MEKRTAKRIITGYHVTVTSGVMSYDGIIEDLSEKGVGMTTVISKSKVSLFAGDMADLTFQPSSDETITLSCLIKWVQDAPPQGMKSRVGLEIIDPPWDESGVFL